MDKKLPNLWGGIMEKLKLGSVLDPLIAVLVIFGTLLAIAIIKNITWLIVTLVIIAIVILLIIIVVYIVWSFKDPDKLRSSEHEIKKLQIMHGMGDNTNPLEGEIIQQDKPIPNPEAKQLKRGGTNK